MKKNIQEKRKRGKPREELIAKNKVVGFKISKKIKEYVKKNIKEIANTSADLDKQMRVIELIAQGWAISRAMSEAGYSEAYSKHPEKLIRTKTFNKLKAFIFPQYRLLEIAHKFANLEEVIYIKNKKTGEVGVISTGRLDKIQWKIAKYFMNYELKLKELEIKKQEAEKDKNSFTFNNIFTSVSDLEKEKKEK